MASRVTKSGTRGSSTVPFVIGFALVILIIAALALFMTSRKETPQIASESGTDIVALATETPPAAVFIQGKKEPVTIEYPTDTVEIRWESSASVQGWQVKIVNDGGETAYAQAFDTDTRSLSLESAMLPVGAYAVTVEPLPVEGEKAGEPMTGAFTLEAVHQVLYARMGISRQLLAYLDQQGNVMVESASGDETMSAEAESWQDVAQVAVGTTHVVALTRSGAVLGAGSNDNGQLDCVGLESVRWIAAGSECTACVLDDGTVQLYGLFSDARGALSNVVNVNALSISQTHIAVCYQDGTAECFPLSNERDAIGDGVAAWSDLKQVSAGYGYALGVRNDGTVLYAGSTDGDTASCADWTDIEAVDAGNGYALGIKTDGTVVSAGNPQLQFKEIPDWTDVEAVGVGYDQCAAIQKDGTLLRSKL